MYDNSAVKDFTTIIYAVKLYRRIVKISNDLYKKNFSVFTVQLFSKCIRAGRKDLMTSLLERKIKDSVNRQSYLEKLTPPKTELITWPV